LRFCRKINVKLYISVAPSLLHWGEKSEWKYKKRNGIRSK